MTANIFAALLDGVPKEARLSQGAITADSPLRQEEWVRLSDVLAALAAAVPADLAEAGKVLEGVTLNWDRDGRKLHMDQTMAFSKSYDWDGWDCFRQEGYGDGANYIIWPDSIGSEKWNLYGTADGLFITDLDGEIAAKAAAQKDYEAHLGGPTSGPWRIGNLESYEGDTGIAFRRVYFSTTAEGEIQEAHVRGNNCDANARFIARCREGVPALLARIAAQEAHIGEQGRLVRDLTKRARDAEEQRDQNRDTSIEFETALAAMTKERDAALHFLDVAVDKSPEPLKKLGKHLASLLDEDDWPTAERFLNGAATALAAERAKVAKLVEYYEASEAILSIEAEWRSRKADGLLDGSNIFNLTDKLTAAEARLAKARAAITEAGHE